jgi:tetratricopeptide (TPR) repeat protein
MNTNGAWLLVAIMAGVLTWPMRPASAQVSSSSSSTPSLDELQQLVKARDQLVQQGRFAEAIPVAQQILEGVRQLFGSEDPVFAAALNSLGLMYYNTRAYEQAEPLYQQALEIERKSADPKDPVLAAILNNLAVLYEHTKRYSKAEPLLQEALRISKEIRGPEHPDVATALNNLAALYYYLNEYAKAEALYQEALQMRKELLGPEHPDVAGTLNNLAALYEGMGEYAKALEPYEEALRIEKKALGAEHPDVATALHNLAGLYVDMGEYAKAEPLYQEALQIRKKVLGPENADVAVTLNDLAWTYDRMGEYAKAKPLYEEALQIRKKVLAPEDPDTAATLHNLASVYYFLGEYVKAESLYQEALQIRRKILGPEHPDVAETLSDLARLYRDWGEYAKAKPLYEEALQIRKNAFGPEDAKFATSLNDLAGLYYRVGQYEEAEPLYQEALQIEKKVLGAEDPRVAPTLNNLALLYRDIGEYAKAERLYQEALRIEEKALGQQRASVTGILNNLALLYCDTGEYVKAEPLYREALEIETQVFGSEHPRTAETLGNLAELYYDEGEYVKAEPLFQEALRIGKKSLGLEHPLVATTLNNLALLYHAMGEYEKAEPLYREALRIARKAIGDENPSTRMLLSNLAFLEKTLGHSKEALILAREEAEIRLKNVDKILSFTSEQKRLAYMATQDPIGLFAALGSEEDLFATLLHFKGVVLDSIIEDRRLAEAMRTTEEERLLQELELDRRKADQLLFLPVMELTPEKKQEIDQLETRIETIQGTRARQTTNGGQVRSALTITRQAVQARIPADGVLIEFARYWRYSDVKRSEAGYGAVILGKQGQPVWVSLGTANEIDALVKRYQTLTARQSTDEDLTVNLANLYRAIWAPVQDALPKGTRRIILSPDDQLNFLSFAVLLCPDGRFLAEQFQIQYVASARDLVRELNPVADHHVVVFANPDFDLDSSKLPVSRGNSASMDDHVPFKGSELDDVQTWSFQKLATSGEEAEKLIKMFANWGWSSTSFIGANARKIKLLNEVHSPYILHLSTHGVFAKEEVGPDSGALEKLRGSDEENIRFRFFKNPMHRSAIALAGAQRTMNLWRKRNSEFVPANTNEPPRDEVIDVEDNGIVTAEDVGTLDLTGTWLATLSACETGLGETRAGEGVMGLRRGFVEAGAQNLLMTLWPISAGEVTVEFMLDFYRAAHESGNAALALANVQREWLVALRDGKGDQFERVKETIAVGGRGGFAKAVRLAGAFVMSSQGKP